MNRPQLPLYNSMLNPHLFFSPLSHLCIQLYIIFAPTSDTLTPHHRCTHSPCYQCTPKNRALLDNTVDFTNFSIIISIKPFNFRPLPHPYINCFSIIFFTRCRSVPGRLLHHVDTLLLLSLRCPSHVEWYKYWNANGQSEEDITISYTPPAFSLIFLCYNLISPVCDQYPSGILTLHSST